MAPKPGSRALGIAASDAANRSQLCGAVIRGDRIVDDLVFCDVYRRWERRHRRLL